MYWKFASSLFLSHVSFKVFYSSLNKLFIHFEHSHEISFQFDAFILFLLPLGILPTKNVLKIFIFIINEPRKL